jgi:hypothetical protein
MDISCVKTVIWAGQPWLQLSGKVRDKLPDLAALSRL